MSKKIEKDEATPTTFRTNADVLAYLFEKIIDILGAKLAIVLALLFAGYYYSDLKRADERASFIREKQQFNESSSNFYEKLGAIGSDQIKNLENLNRLSADMYERNQNAISDEREVKRLNVENAELGETLQITQQKLSDSMAKIRSEEESAKSYRSRFEAIKIEQEQLIKDLNALGKAYKSNPENFNSYIQNNGNLASLLLRYSIPEPEEAETLLRNFYLSALKEPEELSAILGYASINVPDLLSNLDGLEWITIEPQFGGEPLAYVLSSGALDNFITDLLILEVQNGVITSTDYYERAAVFSYKSEWDIFRHELRLLTYHSSGDINTQNIYFDEFRNQKLSNVLIRSVIKKITDRQISQNTIVRPSKKSINFFREELLVFNVDELIGHQLLANDSGFIEYLKSLQGDKDYKHVWQPALTENLDTSSDQLRIYEVASKLLTAMGSGDKDRFYQIIGERAENSYSAGTIGASLNRNEVEFRQPVIEVDSGLAKLSLEGFDRSNRMTFMLDISFDENIAISSLEASVKYND